MAEHTQRNSDAYGKRGTEKRTPGKGRRPALLLLAGALFFAACGGKEAVYELNSGSTGTVGESVEAADLEEPAKEAAQPGGEKRAGEDGGSSETDGGDTAGGDAAGGDTQTGADTGDTAEPPAGETGEGTRTASEADGRIYIYICGAVAAPGVYPMEPGSRVYELIEAAGGLLAEADERLINQAGLLEDGQQITVYTKEETAAGLGAEQKAPEAGAAGSADSSGEAGDRVNLNTAGKEELMTLDGIGEARAEAILKYREENGGFRSIEEIMEIDGIKEKLFEKIRDRIEI